MANQALIQGAAAVAPKFNNPMDAFNKSFQEGLSKTVEIKKKEDEAAKKEDEWKADQIANLATVETEGVPEGLYDSVAGEASALYDKAYDLINKKGDMSASEYAIAMRGITADINQLQQTANTIKELGSDTKEALEIGIAPFSDGDNQVNVLGITNNKFKKKLVKGKDGKYVVQFENGKQVSLNNLKPLEVVDYKTLSNYETTLQQKFDKLSITSTSMTPERVKTFANDQVNTLTPQQFKSLALHYKVGGETEAEQYNYFQNTSEDQIKKDLAESIVERFTPRAEDLNEARTAKQTTSTKNNFTAGLRQELQTRYGEAAKYASIANSLKGKMEGGNIESKMKFILKEMKAMNPDINLITRGDAYNSFYKNRKAEWDNATKTERKEDNLLDPNNTKDLRNAFKDKYGDAQFFDSKTLQPRDDIDTTDPIDLFNLMMGEADMTDEAKAVFRDQFMPGLVGEKRKEEKTKGQGFNYQPGSNMDPNNVRIETTYNGIKI